jgi:hypothetical protein
VGALKVAAPLPSRNCLLTQVLRRRSAELRSPRNVPARRRCSFIKSPSCKNSNFCTVDRGSRFTRDFGVQKFDAKVHLFAGLLLRPLGAIRAMKSLGQLHLTYNLLSPRWIGSRGLSGA